MLFLVEAGSALRVLAKYLNQGFLATVANCRRVFAIVDSNCGVEYGADLALVWAK